MRSVDIHHIYDLKWFLKDYGNGTTVTAEKRRTGTLRLLVFTTAHFLIRYTLVESATGNDCHQQYING